MRFATLLLCLVFALPAFAERTDAQKAIWEKIPEADRETFHARRKFVLGALERILKTPGLATGLGAITRGKLFLKKDEPNGINPVDEVVDRASAEGPPLSRAEAKQKLIADFLDAADDQLWDRAPIVSRVSEFGFQGFIGCSAALMVGKRGAGVAPGFGISVGVNPRDRAIVFELYQGTELLQGATVAAKLGVGMKLQAYAINRGEVGGPVRIVNNARGFYGLKLPVVGRPYLTASPNMIGVGTVIGLGGIPISDLASWAGIVDKIDMWETRVTRVPLLRVTLSPMVPFFIKVQTSEELLPAMKHAVTRVAGRIAAPFIGCGGYFARMIHK